MVAMDQALSVEKVGRCPYISYLAIKRQKICDKVKFPLFQ